MSAERKEWPDVDLVELLARYRDEIAKLNRLERGSSEYYAQVKVEVDLSQERRSWGSTHHGGIRD